MAAASSLPGSFEPPVALLCAHGTRDPAGQAVLLDLRRLVDHALAGVRVELCYVDVQRPAVDECVAQLLAAGRRVVVVPLLLTLGYHTEVDIPAALRAGAGRAVACPPLGPDALLTAVLCDRLVQAGAAPDDPVVLAAVGSSRPEAAGELRRVRAELAARRRGPVTLGFGGAGAPSVAEAVQAARAGAGERPVTLAGYLLAPGFFHTRLAGAGADRVTAPLAADPRIVELILGRYRQGAAALARAGLAA